MRLLTGLLILSLLFSACSGYRQFIDSLNERKLQSCIQFDGSIRASGSLFASGHVALEGVTATGGATMEQCLEAFGQEIGE